MRMWVWLAGLMIGLAFAEQGHAQMFGFGGNSSGNGNRSGGFNRSSGNVSTFRLRDLFPSIPGFGNRPNTGRSTYPDPNSPEYLKLFGYRKLF